MLIPDCNPVPGLPTSCGVIELIQLAVNIYNFLLGFMAIIAVLILVYCGIRLFLYQFEEKPEAELEAVKLTIRRAIYGMILIICAYLIVFTLLWVLGVQNGPGGAGTVRGFLNSFGFPI